MSQIVPYDQVDPKLLPADSYVVFGGTFDPPHLGHTSVIQLLRKLFSFVIIAPTSANPWKVGAPTELKLRKVMIESLCEQENIELSYIRGQKGVAISTVAYSFTEELVNECRKGFGQNIYWAIGEDSAETVPKWRNWEQLNLTVISCPVTVNLHSTEMRSKTVPLHPSLLAFARFHHLYGY